jgi:hypothetical protein
MTIASSDGRHSRLAPPPGTVPAVMTLLLPVLLTPLLGGSVVLVAPALGVLLAALMIARREHAALLGYALWLWVMTPFLRRFLDWLTFHHDVSPVLATAPLVSLVSLAAIVRGRPVTGLTAVIVAMTTTVVAIVYGTAVGALSVGLVPAVAAGLELLAPLALAVFALVCLARDDALRVLEAFARWGILVVGGYAIVQFLWLPAWDSQWMIDSGVVTLGLPVPLDVRVFSTLNSAGPLAYALSALLLLVVVSATQRHRGFDAAVLVIGYTALALSLVRGAWIAHVVALAYLLLIRLIRPTRVLAVGTVLVLGAALLGGAIVEQVQDRVTTSVDAGTQDTSLNARLALQQQLSQAIAQDPWGAGLGSTGLATQLAESQIVRSNVDSGVFETLVTSGLLAGGLVIVTLLAAGVAVARRGASFPSVAGPAAVSLSLLIGFLFTDTRKGVYGVLLWLCLAVAGSLDTRPETPSPAAVDVAAGGPR